MNTTEQSEYIKALNALDENDRPRFENHQEADDILLDVLLREGLGEVADAYSNARARCQFEY